MTEIIFWAVALVALLIIEGMTAQLVTIWFAAGALVSLIMASLKLPVWTQIVAFIVVSCIALAVTRPLVKKLTKKTKQPLNANRCIGKTAVVTEKIDNINATGAAKVDGTVWTARTSDNSIIEEGKTVTIEKIEGVKIIVKEK